MLALLVPLSTACGTSAVEIGQIDASLREALTRATRPPYVTADAEGKALWGLTQQFYERREYAPGWIDGTSPRSQMADLIEALNAAREEGLDPDLYNVSLLAERRAAAAKGFLTKAGFDPEEAGALDVWLTYLYMKYASDLAQGLGDLAHADRAWQIRPEPFDAADHLQTALEANEIKASLLDLLPRHPQYRALRDSLAEHRAQEAAGGWPEVPATLRLKPGQKGPMVVRLAQRLAASGDYEGRIPEDTDRAEYGKDLQDAVKRFQRRHGLADDGAVGAPTAAALNVPIGRRIQDIELNLERWRWLPRRLGDRYILVNIPEYRLEVREGDRVALEMRVVVGKQDTPTPVFNGDMTYLVFSPYWNVPPDIARGETLPSLLRDPGFLDRNNMEVLDRKGNVIDASAIDPSDPASYRFRQRPGAQNSLGRVKFMFPNEHHVYLHDTPANSHFARASRSFSHGCVRVEGPEQLAAYLLRDQKEWTTDRIREAMAAGEERTVKLSSPVPVYLGYWTAAVVDGQTQFRRDVYGIDGRQLTLLANRLGRLRKAAEAARAAAAPAPAPRGASARSSE